MKTGDKRNMLTVLEVIPKTYRLRCECGNIIERDASNVDSGRTKSCGCLKKLGNNRKK